MTLHPDDITLAARVMTDVEPPRDLHARITRRLDAETLRVAPRTTRFLWPTAGLAAAGLVAFVMVQSPADSGSRGPEVAGVPGSRGPEVVDAKHREPRNSRTPGHREPRNPGTSTQRSNEAELAWLSRRIPALEVIDPLAVDRLTFESIQPEAMLITPLTITPLVTSPVHGDPDAGRQQFD